MIEQIFTDLDAALYDIHSMDECEIQQFKQVIAAFFNYRQDMQLEIIRLKSHLCQLKQAHLELIQEKYLKRIERLDIAIDNNALFCFTVVAAYKSLFPQIGKFTTIDKMKFSEDVPSKDITKVRVTLKQLMRDWSIQGKSERELSQKPILEEIQTYFTNMNARPRILVPGCGLGRLLVELAALGFEAQGNEYSLFMLLGSHFVINLCSEQEQFTIYPFLNNFCNRLKEDHIFEAIKIPDVVASSIIKGPLSIAAGDFLDTYKDHVNHWDAVVTQFFLDTAMNIMDYIDTIHRILKPGGIWVNYGPLEYHYATQYTQLSIELSWEDVQQKILQLIGNQSRDYLTSRRLSFMRVHTIIAHQIKSGQFMVVSSLVLQREFEYIIQMKSQSSRNVNTSSLRSLLEQQQIAKCKTISSPTRDVSHITDYSRRLNKQLQDKSINAYRHLEEFIQQKAQMKRAMPSPQILIRSEDEMKDLLDILETFQDINFEGLEQDLSEPTDMQRMQLTLEQQTMKGSFDQSPKASSKHRLRMFLKPTSTNSAPGRVDAINLKKWLHEQILHVKRQPINSKEKLQQAEGILFQALNDLIKQVSYTCLERGQLMMAIFKGYIKMFKKTLKMNEFDRSTIRVGSYKSELELQIKFEKNIEVKDHEITSLKQQIAILEKKDKISNHEIQNLSNQNKILQKQLDYDKKVKNQATNLILTLDREAKTLRNKLTTRPAISSIRYVEQSDEEYEEQNRDLSQIIQEADKFIYVEENSDIVVKDHVDEQPVIMYSVATQIEPKDIKCTMQQTDLQLFDPKYDRLLIHDELTNLLKESELKQQLSNYNEDQQPQQKGSLLKILDQLPQGKEQHNNLSMNEMFDLFQKNIHLIKQVVQKDEMSETEQSMIDNDFYETTDNQRSSRDIPMPQRDSISSQRGINKPSKQIIRQQTKIIPQSKFGTQELSELRSQVQMLITLYNVQVQQTENSAKQINESGELLQKLFQFTRKLLTQLTVTLKLTHRQIVEEFLYEFELLRNIMPMKSTPITIRDDQIQQEEEEKDKDRKHQNIMKKKKKQITRALQFNFTYKVQKASQMDKMAHPGVLLTLKVKEQMAQMKKAVSYLPIKNVLKIITQIYEDRIRSSKENPAIKDLEMQIFLFNNFLNRYGFKNVAEKKFIQFLVSIVHFSSLFRVNVFARIICLLQDQTNFTVEETQFFLQGLEFMNSESSLGTTVVQSESEQKFHVSYLRALDYLKVHLENKLLEEELRELRIDIENLKEPDPKNQNKAGLVDVDILMVKVIAKYRIITLRTKQFVIHAFEAADLDGNKKINHNEFITLFRHIEPQKFNLKNAIQLFDEQADLFEGDEKNFSFNRFTSVCVNQQIFTEASLNAFIHINQDKDLESQFQMAKIEFPIYKIDIHRTLLELQPFVTTEIYSDWNKVLTILEERVNQPEVDAKPVLIAHRILKLELERLLKISQQDDEIEDFD